MSKLPVLAIVGRPNVGKSALFNRLCKRRLAIVEETEGVTRDRLYAKAEHNGFPFLVVDTGGINPQSADPFQDVIQRQALSAIEEADSIILVVDGMVGPQKEDLFLARLLLKTKKSLCLAINKVDSPSQYGSFHSFYSLGIPKMIEISASHGLHIDSLIHAAWDGFSSTSPAPSFDGVKIAFVGRPNVGKSSLINALLQEERCVVSPLAGTTRDQVEIPFHFDQNPYLLIDTAGIRKKKSLRDKIENWASLRTTQALETADICLLVIDVQEGITTHEKRIAHQIEEAGKGCIILLNKWDLIKGFRMEHCLKALHEQIPFLAHCPALFTSALTGRNLHQLFPLIQQVYGALSQRVPTPQLNRFLKQVMSQYQPPQIGGKRLRIYYLTQVETSPPKFVLFVNRTALMNEPYKRYLINQFREHFPFSGVPLEFQLRGKNPSPSKQQRLARSSPSFLPSYEEIEEVDQESIDDDSEEECEEFDDAEFALAEESLE